MTKDANAQLRPFKLVQVTKDGDPAVSYWPTWDNANYAGAAGWQIFATYTIENVNEA